MINIKTYNEIFIPFNVPSSKNSKIMGKNGVFNNKTVTKYLSQLNIKSFSSSKKLVAEYKLRPNLFTLACKVEFSKIDRTKPIILHIHFIRGSKHRFDFINICQIILDLLVAHDFIEDDNMDYLIPFPMFIDNKWYSYDKTEPGVILKIIQ